MKKITLGRADCGRPDIALRKEWLVTNGLGGYAASTISGANTRRYHGLLVAALRPPLKRTLLVAKLDAVAHYDGDGRIYPLATNEYADGAIDPHGYQHLESFHLEGLTPVWVYALADACLEQRIWMVHGRNTTYITYTLTRALDSVFLKLTPFCTYRDHHGHSHNDWQPQVVPITGGFRVKAFDKAQPYRIVADSGEFNRDEDWYWRFKYRAETYRGLEDTEDLFVPGHFRVTLQPGETVTLICSTEPTQPHPGHEALQTERRRQIALAKQRTVDEPAWISHLALSADQFIVQRLPAHEAVSIDKAPPADKALSTDKALAIDKAPPANVAASAGAGTSNSAKEAGQTVIAGYPWFGDWGRHTMMALPGLTLCTGRFDAAAAILRTFAGYLSQGMLPSHFPDTGQEPAYNSVDATLWYFYAIYQYLLYSDDLALVEELYPGLLEIIEWHQRGTRYNIYVDPSDGLLYAGYPGQQLTWMDARVGQHVFTPRIGKPVEVNALWHAALRIMAVFSERLQKAEAAQQFNEQADNVAANFQRCFWFEAGEYLYDVVDSPNGTPGPDGKRCDHTLRPNQILAVSLPFKLLPHEQAKAIVDICALRLLTSHGLRSLVAQDRAYAGHYGGTPFERDNAYHQGTVWAWLLGPFVTAHYRVYGDAQRARSFLLAMEHHLLAGCLGSISEIFDGDPPHTPRGCFAQAWSVAEVLRAWRELP